MDVLGNNPNGLMIDQAAAGAMEARLRRLGQSAPDRESLESLQKTAKEFEAVFLNQLMKVMRETVPENELFNGGGATKYYQQMHDAEVANAMATGRSGLGIADLIVQQFAANVNTEEAAVAAGGAAGGADAPGGPAPSPATRPVPAAEPGREVFGPPAPQQTRLGPTAPVVQLDQIAPPASIPNGREAIARYRSMSPVGERVAAMARLRGLAAAQGDAVADTLQRFEFEIGSASVNSGLDPSLILAVVMEESGGNPLAQSPKGAVGLMQLMPGTAAEVGVSDRTSPTQNLQGGADYLARMMRRYEDRLDLALAAYNAGPGNVDKAGGRVPPFKETERYVQRVMDRYNELGGRGAAGTKIAID